MQNILQKIKKIVMSNNSMVFIALIVLCIVLSVLSPHFLKVKNILNILLQSATIGIMAVGASFVIISGGIDLSNSSIMALTGVFAALIQSKSLALSILASLAAGLLFGYLNGVIITKMKVQPFILTLGSGMVLRGLAFVITNGEPIYGVSDAFYTIGGGSIGIIPVPVLILFVIIILAQILLKHRKFGRYTYALGGNEEAARLSGIKTDSIKISVYCISGILAALSGIILTARLISADCTAGTGYEMDAVAAVVIGGTSLKGGKGTIIGTVIGILLIQVVSNGLNILDVSPYVQKVVKGAIIMLAVMSDRLQVKEA
jgi:ribose transport system permease protein